MHLRMRGEFLNVKVRYASPHFQMVMKERCIFIIGCLQEDKMTNSHHLGSVSLSISLRGLQVIFQFDGNLDQSYYTNFIVRRHGVRGASRWRGLVQMAI